MNRIFTTTALVFLVGLAGWAKVPVESLTAKGGVNVRLTGKESSPTGRTTEKGIRVRSCRAGSLEARQAWLSPEEWMRLNGKPSPFDRSKASEGRRVDLNIQLDYNTGEYEPVDFYFYNHDVAFSADVWEYSEDECESITIPGIQEGTYTFVIRFDELKSHAGHGWSPVLVFVEDKKIEGPTTFTVNPDDASILVKGISYLPGGEEARESVASGLDESHNPIVVEEGNIKYASLRTLIYDMEYDNYVANIAVSSGGIVVKDMYGPGIDWDTMTQSDFYVNQISPRYVIAQSRLNYTDDGAVVTTSNSQGLPDGPMANNWRNFREHSEFFTHTLQGSDEEDTVFVDVNLACNGWAHPILKLLHDGYENIPTTVFYSSSDNFGKLSTPVTALFSITCGDYDSLIGVIGQKFTFDADDDVFYRFSNGYHHPAVAGGSKVDDEGRRVWEGDLAFNAGLSFTSGSMLNYTYANSAPVNVMYPVNYLDGNSIWTGLVPRYVGLMGEVRQLDFYTLGAILYHNGEKVDASDESGQIDWNRYWQTAPNEDPTGTYGFTLFNNVNCEIDGLQGFNTTHMEWSYEWDDDFNPPALQAVQVRDSQGRFTQELESPEGARVIVCAGDYDWWVDGQDGLLLSNYDTNPLEIKVEYAPYAEYDDTSAVWRELPVSLDDTYKNQASYGYFATVALDGIEEYAREGWFNLKVTLTDERGFVNSQMFGPVFRIANRNGVAGMEDEETRITVNGRLIELRQGDASRISVYSADGRLVARTQGSVLDASALETGVYVIKAEGAGSGSTLKVVF